MSYMNYEERLEVAKRLYELSNTEQKTALKCIFPELCESEDEKIRRDIISYIKLANEFIPQFQKDKWIAWLEKQGESYTKRDIDDAFVEGMALAKEELEKQGGSFIKWNKNTKDNKPPFNHSVLIRTKSGISEGEWRGGNQWLQYRWSGIVRDSDVTGWMELSVLEKQGEQKPLFKVGDFYTDGYNIYQVKAIGSDRYFIKSDEGHEGVLLFGNEEHYHLWTIQDAKAGDVLTSHECYVIFKEIDGLNIKCYCTYHYMNNPSFHVDTLHNKDAFHPATKEQRDLLFSKMKELGYAWDFEKKELNHIEQNLEMVEALRTEYEKGRADAIAQMKEEWSEEDEYMLDETIQHLKQLIEIDKAKHCACDVQYYQRDIDWLKFLKNRVQLQPKQEWSKEDEFIALGIEQIVNCASLLNIAPDSISKIRNWLKSLKDRYTWKPSDEQMEELSVAKDSCFYLGYKTKNALKSLYKDLKKLK